MNQLKTCGYCKSEYAVKRRGVKEWQKSMFCSVKCKMLFRNSPENNPTNRADVRAKLSQKRKGKNYCTGRVLSEETRLKIAAGNTGKKHKPESIQKIKAAGIARFADPETLKQQQEHLNRIRPSKDNHWNWKGGTTSQRGKERKTIEYRTFVNAVLKRDNYICQTCGAKNGHGLNVKLEVHHILSYAEHPELRFEVSNGITLCFSCHNKTKRNNRLPKRIDFVPAQRVCEMCGQGFGYKYGKKFCPDCKVKIQCPVCRSRTCSHSARKKSVQVLLVP